MLVTELVWVYASRCAYTMRMHVGEEVVHMFLSVFMCLHVCAAFTDAAHASAMMHFGSSELNVASLDDLPHGERIDMHST